MKLNKIKKQSVAVNADEEPKFLRKIIKYIKLNNKNGIASAVGVRKHLRVRSKEGLAEVSKGLRFALSIGYLELASGKGANGSYRITNSCPKYEEEMVIESN